VLSGCGIFTPRDNFENPLAPNDKNTGSFSFNELMKFVGIEGLNNSDLDELFDFNFSYNIRADENNIDKVIFIANLKAKNIQYPKLTVKWEKTIQPSTDNNEISFREVKYSIYLYSDTILSAYTGKSHIIIRKIENTWKIFKWTDIPDETDKNSFFSPDGSQN
jgi:hypothetical protein